MRMLHLVAMAGLALGSIPAMAGATDLRARAEAFAGQPVRVDPRLRVPHCPAALVIAWRGDDRRALLATCPATAWRLVLPVGAGETGMGNAMPVFRRGEPVTVEAAGPGYAVRIDAVAQGDGRPGRRMMVKNPRSGTLVPVDVRDDGTLSLSGAR